MRHIITFVLILYFSTSSMQAQKDSIEFNLQEWTFEQIINETMDDFGSYLWEIAGATYRKTNEKMLAKKYVGEVLRLFARNGNAFCIEGIEYTPMITFVDKQGKIVRRLSPRRFCAQIMTGPRIPEKFIWCKMKVANFTKEHCKQISSNEYVIDALVDTGYANDSMKFHKWEEGNLKKIKVVARRAMIDTPNGPKEYYAPYFIDLYAIIP